MGRLERDTPVEILLVEDNPADARLAAEALKESSVKTRLHWAADGERAMDFLRGSEAGGPRPDLILLDLNLPNKDGRELLAEIKGNPRLRTIPVIVLTCSQAESDRLKAYELQANCFLTKPLEWADFLETMKAIGDFWFTLVRLPGHRPPVGREGEGGTVSAPPESGRAEVAPGEAAGLKILLVEDNSGDARLVREMLGDSARNEARLVSVGRLSEGLERLRRESFDAVLLDLSLPDSQGLETLLALQAQAVGVPLVVLTGMEDEGIAARALQQGAQDYLVKGRFGGDLLLHSVGNAIERMRSGRLVHHLAHHDGLTDLPNRILLQDRLKQAVEHARRNSQALAVLFIDLDHFKKINDTLGHAVGDELLVHVAARLRGCVRASDTVARVGGDEFIILFPEITRIEDVTIVADKIMQAFSSPIDVGGREVTTSVSIGASRYPHDGEDPETLVKNADAAMYRAKELGRARCQFYSRAAGDRATERLKLDRQLRRAIERDELLLHFQPIVDARSGRVVALEALARWQRPEAGLVQPEEFLPLAEETGSIVMIGEWALGRACAQARAWESAGLEPPRVSVNLSSRHLRKGPELVSFVRRVMEENDLSPHRLEVEITEEAIARNETVAIRTLRDLHGSGIRIAVDNFGKGIASLSRLRSFPFAAVKIDRSFVVNAMLHPDDAAIVSAIATMARSLRMDVVAEGVEAAGQVSFLLRHGIELMQGIYFGDALPAEACAERLLRGAA